MKPNNNTAFTRPGRILLPAVSLALLQACSTFSPSQGHSDTTKKGRMITVTSTPAGATVRADGKKLGQTPLEIDLEKSFSRKWVSAEDYGIVRRLRGELSVEKNGCNDYTVPVTGKSPAGDIDVTLVCTQQAPAVSKRRPSMPAPIPAPAPTPTPPDNMEKRLQQLEKLYRDGAISADEYKQHRSRILGEL